MMIYSVAQLTNPLPKTRIKIPRLHNKHNFTSKTNKRSGVNNIFCAKIKWGKQFP